MKNCFIDCFVYVFVFVFVCAYLYVCREEGARDGAAERVAVRRSVEGVGCNERVSHILESILYERKRKKLKTSILL